MDGNRRARENNGRWKQLFHCVLPESRRSSSSRCVRRWIQFPSLVLTPPNKLHSSSSRRNNNNVATRKEGRNAVASKKQQSISCEKSNHLRLGNRLERRRRPLEVPSFSTNKCEIKCPEACVLFLLYTRPFVPRSSITRNQPVHFIWLYRNYCFPFFPK